MEEEIKYKFEQRTYKEDGTEEEIQAIKDRVFIYDEGIVYLKEAKTVNSFTINLVFDEMERLGRQTGKHGLLVDISNTQRPDAQTRRVINSRFSRVCESIEHVAFCTGKNIIINSVARFVMYQTNLDSYSIHKTVEAAVRAIKEKVND